MKRKINLHYAAACFKRELRFTYKQTAYFEQTTQKLPYLNADIQNKNLSFFLFRQGNRIKGVVNANLQSRYVN